LLLMVQFTVYGKPQPAGSKRAFVVKGRAVVTDDNAKSKPWKQEVSGTALRAMSDAGVPWMEGPLGLTCVFYLARPKGHYGSGRNAAQVKESAPPFPVVKPDATKLVRGVEDALTGIVWKDDAQVVAQTVLKRYGEPERVEVTVTRAEP
jgi:Holliday junction resolvase RusA-like endonuclease